MGLGTDSEFTTPHRLDRAWFLTLAAFVAFSPASAATWIEVDKLLASDGVESAIFGYSIAMDGDTAIIGAFGDRGEEGEAGESRGAAYIYTRDNIGNWTEQAKLLPTFSGFAHQFGYSVDIDGDIAIVGMFEEDLNPVEDSAYIFTRDASGNWSEQAVLTASDGIFGDGFSVSVAIDGDTAFVGTRPETFTGFVDLPGAVYVFTRDASGNWTEQAKLLASDGAIGDTFGRTIDLDGNTAIIGRQRNDEDGTGTVRASAYIFTRDASGNWTEQTKLLASERTVFEREFGAPRPVAIHGTTAIMSAGRTEDGRSLAYVFGRNPSGIWSDEAELAIGGGGAEIFGLSVALTEDTAVIGEPDDDDNGSLTGSAYVFTRDTSGTWTEQAKLLASDGESRDFFGGAVAVHDDTVIVGSFGDDDNGADGGSAYVFQLVDALLVDIDIKPRKGLNNINPSSRQKVAVAVLTTDTFDALQVDPLSVEFGPAGASEFHGRGHAKDVDKDGDVDLLLHFDTQDTGIICGDNVATLTGETFGGQSITGSDSVRARPCKSGTVHDITRWDAVDPLKSESLPRFQHRLFVPASKLPCSSLWTS